MLQKYMTDGLYKNKYRIKSTRLAGYDYARDGYYFVTICTENREMFFGNVVGGKMILNEIGKLVADEWKKTEIIRPNVFLYERVIMPNHIHGILIINNSKNGIRTMRTTPMAIIQPKEKIPRTSVETPCQDVSAAGVENMPIIRSTVLKPRTAAVPTTAGGRKPEWKPGTLGAIINQFKRQCAINIRKTINPDFTWQTRFYDHIIRNEKSLYKIRQYIMNNPEKWKFDRNNSENLWM